MNSILKYDAMGLSYVASRADYLANGNGEVLDVAFEMASRAASLRPLEYGQQITLAKICLSRKDKANGLVAAKAARELANESTSKIQNLAQKVLDDIQAL
jgi:hypothetical protein